MTAVRIVPWGESDLALLERLVGEGAICRALGFTLLGTGDVEYPPGNPMRCNDWRLALVADQRRKLGSCWRSTV
ncbi:MAG: hypothetical protein ACXWZZ_09185 [Solirubrobacteraceae bacterium]